MNTEKDCYQEIIAEVSKKLAEKFIASEKKSTAKSTLIDSGKPESAKKHNFHHFGLSYG